MSAIRYRQMAQMPRYLNQQYELVNGLERKLFSTIETIRYRNFFDGPTMENLSIRLEHHRMLLRNLKAERLTAPQHHQEGIEASIKNTRVQIKRLRKLMYTSNSRLETFCRNNRNMPREQGLERGINGFTEVLEPISQAIIEDRNYTIAAGMVTTTTVVVAAVLVSPDLTPDVIKLWINLMEAKNAIKPPGSLPPTAPY